MNKYKIISVIYVQTLIFKCKTKKKGQKLILKQFVHNVKI